MILYVYGRQRVNLAGPFPSEFGTLYHRTGGS